MKIRCNLKTVKKYIEQIIRLPHKASLSFVQNEKFHLPCYLSKDHCNTLEMLFLFLTAEGAVLANNLFQIEAHSADSAFQFLMLLSTICTWVFSICVCMHLSDTNK